MSSSKSERVYLEKYQDKGYKVNFRVRDNLLLPDTKEKSYKVDEFKIVSKHRFEGISNPSDLSILFVIKTDDQLKGTILVTYGSETNTEAAEFFKKVPEENISNQDMIIV